jgi:GPI-anchor transamidase subunit S
LNWAQPEYGADEKIQNSKTAIPLHIFLSTTNLPCEEAKTFVRDTQQALDDLNEHPILHHRLHLVDGGDAGSNSERCGEPRTSLDVGEPALQVHLESSTENFGFGLSTSKVEAQARIPRGALPAAARNLAGIMQDIFREDDIAIALRTVKVAGLSQNAHAFLKAQPDDSAQEVSHQSARSYKASPDYHLTFSLLSAGGAPSSWDIKAVLDRQIEPLVRALSAVANFEITTQIQLYSKLPPSVVPKQREGQNGTYLEESALSTFVNAAEWPLAPSLGSGPTLNFISYIPTSDQVPLRIDGSDSLEWLSPQFGGFQILNPASQVNTENGLATMTDHLDIDTLREPFERFSSQLLLLLGIPQTGGNTQPLQMRLDSFRRRSALSLYFDAAANLGSLARLSQRLHNIPIPRHVAQLVNNALSNLKASHDAVLKNDWTQALKTAKIAYEDSDKAFFDKSMVGQVYFPDEHKVAV